jgi:chitin synthase
MRLPIPNRLRALMLLLLVAALNALAIAALVMFSETYWWAFAPVLALGSASMVYYTSLIVLNWVFWRRAKLEAPAEPVLMLITAYRESGPELEATLESLVAQKLAPGIERSVVVVIDGDRETASYVRTIPADSIDVVPCAYKDWLDAPRQVELRKTTRDGVDVVFVIKGANSGKRDSVVLARTLAYGRIQEDPQPGDYALDVSDALKDAWARFVPIKATRIVGADADTVFDPECVQAMLEEMGAPGKRPVDGVVGVIRTDPSKAKNFREKAWIAYQEVGYAIGQNFMRVYQSRITEKVSCLSGACYAVYVPTMCNPKLLTAFNTPPADDAGLYESILSFASEDRRAVCLALSTDKGVRFKQSLDPRAVAWTVPPTDLKTFLSQRRRWSLGTVCNNLWLSLFGHKLLVVERLVALVTVVGWLFSPLYLAANALFLDTVIARWDSNIVFVSIPMMFVWSAILAMPLVSGYFVGWKDRIAFYPKFVLYIIFGPWMAVLIQWNSLLNAHSVSWGKTVKK